MLSPGSSRRAAWFFFPIIIIVLLIVLLVVAIVAAVRRHHHASSSSPSSGSVADPAQAQQLGPRRPGDPANFGFNLIFNSGAELGANGLLGWTVNNGFQANNNNFGLPGASGQRYFSGGNNNALSSATQTINLTAADAAFIDTGTVTFTLSGWLGGNAGAQNDDATLTITFQNAGGASLGTATIGPVTAAARGNISQLLFRVTTGGVPVGTRSILVTLTMRRFVPNANNGAADNLALYLGP